MMEKSALFYEMVEKEGQTAFPEDGSILVFVNEKGQWFLCDKTMFDFFENGRMDGYSPESDEMISFYNYTAEQWDIFRNQ